MSDILNRYRAVDYKLPESYLSWDLFGAGIENLGRDGKAVELPLRDPNPDEVLLRVDALGLCFSDTKLIWAGPDHPRIRGRDLANDPTVPGHEAALTVVKVGDNWKSKFNVGERYIIQADVFINGEQKAYGYVQRGAMAQYTYAGPWVLDGDDGCYLLPLKDSTGYAEAALVEPWACVEASYHIKARKAPLAGGKLLVVFADALNVEFKGLYDDGASSATAAVLGDCTVDLSPVLGPIGTIKRTEPTADAISAITQEATDGNGFDDIFLIGKADEALIQTCDSALAQDGILAFIGCADLPDTEIDIGRVHYKFTRHVGTTGTRIIDAYTANTRSELAAGGKTWMIGAAGPMGQMHVQRALELDNPPKKVFGTDISEERLEYMRSRLQKMADAKGIDFVCRNVSDATGLDDALNAFTDGKGFDDVYVHAPVAPLVAHGSKFVGNNGVLNIFAGVALGTMAKMSPSLFTERHARMLGSSGSSMNDILGVLNRMEEGKLATRMSLAALGGIEATWLGIKGVKGNQFPGKTVIFPQIRGLDLMSPESLSSACPEAAAKLEGGNVWTSEAENALLENKLKL